MEMCVLATRAGQMGSDRTTYRREGMIQLPGVGWNLLAVQSHRRERKRSVSRYDCC